jgi:hypothetical protein
MRSQFCVRQRLLKEIGQQRKSDKEKEKQQVKVKATTIKQLEAY